MTERSEDAIAPPRTLTGSRDANGVVLPPPASESAARGWLKWTRRRAVGAGPASGAPIPPPAPSTAGGHGTRTVRKARLRLVQVEPWSVMKAAFLLSVAVGIVTVVAVAIVWSVLGAAGLWDSVNTIIRDSIGDNSGSPFEIQEYVGTSRVLGFTMIVAVADVILITAIATLAAFLYNLAAALLGGIEVTFAEDR